MPSSIKSYVPSKTEAAPDAAAATAEVSTTALETVAKAVSTTDNSAL